MSTAASVSASCSQVEPSPVIHAERKRYVLRLVADPAIGTLIEKLFQLLKVHGEAKDSLSLDLLEWGEGVRLIISKYAGDDEPFLERLARKVHELRSIAIRKIDCGPLEHPVIANGRIWEKWILENMHAVFRGVSPYDGEALEEGVDHDFALQVICLINQIFDERACDQLKRLATRLTNLRETEGSGCWLVKEKIIKADPARALYYYQGMVDTELRIEEEECKAETIRKERERMKALREATEKRSAEHVAAAVETMRATEEGFCETVGEIRRTYDLSTEMYKGRLRDKDRELSALAERHEATRERMFHLEGRCTALENRLNAAEAQNHANRGGGDGGCSVM